MTPAAALLVAFVVLWLLQAAGTYLQMRHYRGFFKRVTAENDTGFVGIGNARGRRGRGVIALVVVDDADAIVKAYAMSGRTVFARFAEVPDLIGRTLDEAIEAAAWRSGDVGITRAVSKAAEQAAAARTDRGAELSTEATSPSAAPPVAAYA